MCAECFYHTHQHAKDTSFRDHAFEPLEYNRGVKNTTSNAHAHGRRAPSLAGGAAGAAALPLLVLPQRRHLRLVSILCIDSSHYVAFSATNCSTAACADGAPIGLCAPPTCAGDRVWLMHDSMADRCGGEGVNGYCLPEVKPCPRMTHYLDSDGEQELRALLVADEWREQVPADVRRALADAYICVYADEARAPIS